MSLSVGVRVRERERESSKSERAQISHFSKICKTQTLPFTFCRNLNYASNKKIDMIKPALVTTFYQKGNRLNFFIGLPRAIPQVVFTLLRKTKPLK